MTPTTLIIDRSFPGVGRIKRATGTTLPQVRRKYSRMLTALSDEGRVDILRDLRDGILSFAEVHHAYQRKTLDQLPSAATIKPLAEAMKAWLAELVVPNDISAKHKESLETSRRYFERANTKAPIADVARVLEQLRTSLGRTYPRSFNLARSAASAFIRANFKRSHPLYLAVQAVEPRKVIAQRPHSPLSLEQMRNFFPSPDSDPVDAICWGQATSGMGPGEYWGRWNVLADRIHIAGTKRVGRVRDVPFVWSPAVPAMHRRTWENKVRARTLDRIAPYDFRRTYANWLEAAGIPRTRRKLYLGHGAGDVTGLYELHEVAAHLADDATKLAAFLGLPPTKSHTMTLEKGKGAS